MNDMKLIMESWREYLKGTQNNPTPEDTFGQFLSNFSDDPTIAGPSDQTNSDQTSSSAVGLKDSYSLVELYDIAKRNAPKTVNEEDIITMAAIASAESGGKRKSKAGCRNAKKNPNYSSADRKIQRNLDRKNNSKGQPLERARPRSGADQREGPGQVPFSLSPNSV